MLDEGSKNRLRLWLRGEKALGLTSVGPGDFVLPPPVVEMPRPIARPAPMQAARVPAPPRQPVAPARPAPAPAAAPARMELPQAPSGWSNEPFTSPELSVDEKRAKLATLDESLVRGCTQCGLSQTRSHTVFGEGNPSAQLMFIGEGPGAKEDQSGRPFVGPAGELLNRMIGAMGLKREDVYIANIVKCRAFHPGPPPKDRAPAVDEVSACAPFLTEQVQIIRPRVIVTLGVPSTQFVLQTKSSMSRLRGQWNTWHGIKVMPTWHPSYLLRREKEGDIEPKRQAWADLQLVMKELRLGAGPK